MKSKLLESPAAKWIMTKAHSSDPIQAVEIEVRKLLESCGVKTAPVSVEEIAKKRNIKIAKSVQLKSDGFLMPQRNGFIVKTKKGLNETKYRFTLAHEIGHTLFFDLTTSPPTKRYPYCLLDAGEELLCDRAAAEILMPRVIFKPKLEQHSYSISSLFVLSEVFQASLQASALQMTRYCDNLVIIVWSNIDVSGKGKKLRVKWSAEPDYIYVPTYASNSGGTMDIILSVYESGDTMCGFQKFGKLGSLKGEYYIEACRTRDIFSENDYCVFSMVNLNKKRGQIPMIGSCSPDMDSLIYSANPL